jgi:hypothetical protein
MKAANAELRRLYPSVPRLEAALDPTLTTHCPGCDALVCAPGYWCEDCRRCACPLMLLDADFEDCDSEPDDDYA